MDYIRFDHEDISRMQSEAKHLASALFTNFGWPSADWLEAGGWSAGVLVQGQCQAAGGDVKRIARVGVRVQQRGLAPAQRHMRDLDAFSHSLAAE